MALAKWAILAKKNFGAGICVMNKMECSNVQKLFFYKPRSCTEVG